MSTIGSTIDKLGELTKASQAENARLREALTPSEHTKADYMGEFQFKFPCLDEDGKECMQNINVPWTTIKEIMRTIRIRAEIE